MISHEGTKARRHEERKRESRNAFSLFLVRQFASLKKFLFIPLLPLSSLRAFVPSCLRVKNRSAWLLITGCSFVTSVSALEAKDETIVSPRATYQISQEAIKDGDSRFWTTKLRFAKGKQGCVTLSYGISWPGDFYISPDEKWVLQIQKTGSGDNNGFLYLIEPNHRVWSMSETLCPLAFEFLAHVTKLSESDLYHTGVAFDAWDTKAGLLRFTLHGAKLSGGRIERKLAYNLKEHTIVEP